MDSTPPPADPQQRRPDAILWPDTLKAGRDTYERHAALKARFGPVLGDGMLHHRKILGTDRTLTSLDPHASLRFPGRHPLAGQDRYVWKDDRDGVQFGFLTDEAREDV